MNQFLCYRNNRLFDLYIFLQFLRTAITLRYTGRRGRRPYRCIIRFVYRGIICSYDFGQYRFSVLNAYRNKICARLAVIISFYSRRLSFRELLFHLHHRIYYITKMQYGQTKNTSDCFDVFLLVKCKNGI